MFSRGPKCTATSNSLNDPWPLATLATWVYFNAIGIELRFATLTKLQRISCITLSKYHLYRRRDLKQRN